MPRKPRSVSLSWPCSANHFLSSAYFQNKPFSGKMLSLRYLLVLGLTILAITIVQSTDALQGSQAPFRIADKNSNNIHAKVANAPDRRGPLQPAHPPGPSKSANKCPPGRVWIALFKMCRRPLFRGNSSHFAHFPRTFIMIGVRIVLNNYVV